MLHRSCPDVRESKTACRGFRIPGTEFQFLSVQLGFWIPIIDEIIDSLSCILDSKAQDSRFQKKNFPRNLDSLIWGE